MFQGPSSLNLDGKGRLSVPTRHREVLETISRSQLTITRHPQGCLLVFPRPEWEKFRERILTAPMDWHRYKRLFLGSAMDVDMDATGRVLISPELREAAGIQKEVMLLGMGHYLELWDKARYMQEDAKLSPDAAPAPNNFSF